MAYRLKLPESSRIHPVFHISQLKPVIGSTTAVSELPSRLDDNGELVIEPEEIHDTRYDEEGHLEVLIKWRNLPDHEMSWSKASEVKHQFPTFPLEDKLKLVNGGIDMLQRVYVRKRRERENKGEEEEQSVGR